MSISEMSWGDLISNITAAFVLLVFLGGMVWFAYKIGVEIGNLRGFNRGRMDGAQTVSFMTGKHVVTFLTHGMNENGERSKEHRILRYDIETGFVETLILPPTPDGEVRRGTIPSYEHTVPSEEKPKEK